MKVYRNDAVRMTDSATIYRYIHGGRGVVDLIAPSGNFHTYAFRRPLNSSEFPDDIIFVFAVHEDTKLLYIGVLDGDQFRLTQNSRFLEDTDIVKGAKWIVKMSKNPKFAAESKMMLRHLGMCGRCGRHLTDEKCLQIGFGKKCLQKETC